MASPIAKTCRNGHPHNKANAYMWRGKRACRACRKQYKLLQRSIRTGKPVEELRKMVALGTLAVKPEHLEAIKKGELIRAKVVQQLLGGLSRDAIMKYVKAGLLERGTVGFYTRESVWRTIRWRMNEYADGGQKRCTLKSAIADPNVRKALKKEQPEVIGEVPAGFINIAAYAKAINLSTRQVYCYIRRRKLDSVRFGADTYARKHDLDAHYSKWPSLRVAERTRDLVAVPSAP